MSDEEAFETATRAVLTALDWPDDRPGGVVVYDHHDLPLKPSHYWNLATKAGRAVWELAMAEYEPRLARVRNYWPDGRCRTCSGRLDGHLPGRPHEMRCKHYVGPLEHRWTHTRWNGTFGGVDHDCMCGGWFRKGGLAGHGDGTETAEAICPHADQDWRGPRPAAQKEEQ